jgi:DNA-directed RNA polymerase subunit M/transcription elongation factor TFIIS
MAKCARCGSTGTFIVLARVPDEPMLYHARCTVCEEEWVE